MKPEKIKIKKKQPKRKKKERGYHFTLTMFNLLVRAISLLSLFPASSQPVQPRSFHSQEESFPITMPVTGRDLASFHKTHKQAGEMWNASRGNAAL